LEAAFGTIVHHEGIVVNRFNDARPADIDKRNNVQLHRIEVQDLGIL
jgi:hypothetical protein